MKFRVLRGKHQVFTGELRDKTIYYLPGDVIETDEDLTRFNKKPHSIKFERVPENTLTKEQVEAVKAEQEDSEKGQEDKEDPFENMTVAELKEIAIQDKIDLRGVTKREDILVVLRSHLAEV